MKYQTTIYTMQSVGITILLLSAFHAASVCGAEGPPSWHKTIVKAHTLFGLTHDPSKTHTLRTNIVERDWLPNTIEYSSSDLTCYSDLASGQMLIATRPRNTSRAFPNGTFGPVFYGLTQAEADARALAVVRNVEVPHWDEYRPWRGRYVFQNTSYHSRGTWAYVWHRFIGDHPIWDEFISFEFDDPDGRLGFIYNRTSSRTYPAAKRPKLTADRARQTVKVEWPTRLKQAEKNVATVAIEIKATDLYYRHLDVRHDDFGKLVNPKAERRLRLLYGVGIACGVTKKDGTGYPALETLLVDAETGEMWRDIPGR